VNGAGHTRKTNDRQALRQTAGAGARRKLSQARFKLGDMVLPMRLREKVGRQWMVAAIWSDKELRQLCQACGELSQGESEAAAAAIGTG
jgi:hypothetical protein